MRKTSRKSTVKFFWFCKSGAGYGPDYKPCGKKSGRYFDTRKEAFEHANTVHDLDHAVEVKTLYLFGNGSGDKLDPNKPQR